MVSGVNEVKQKIRSVYERKRMAVYGISLEFAAMAWEYFMRQQPPRPNEPGNFWHNRTAQAAARVFFEAFMTGNSIGWGGAHGVDYGVYLELANDRKHESLRPIIQRYVGRYLLRIKELYVD